MTLVLTVQLFWSCGFEVNVFHDQKRQVFLNFLMMLGAINAIFAYPFNATQELIFGSNITTLFSFAFVQFGLVIINHNSISRFNASTLFMSQKTINRICLVLYFLPFIVFIPIYFAAADRMTKNNLVNMDPWNRQVYKPMTVCLVVVTELLATISDVILLRSVLRIRDQLLDAKGLSLRKANKIQSVSSDLLANYLLTWFFLFFDILVKLSIMAGYPFLFDSIVSILNIALRARTNIYYGLNMRDLFEGQAFESSITDASSIDGRRISVNEKAAELKNESELDLGYYYENEIDRQSSAATLPRSSSIANFY